ncbi:hypothetical protein C5C00_10850 [Rathayibacter rathayi]|uniref:Uncharacterized protein n=2 Tax=Rathayibacter rathayi TaxID=33887 RepID=A0ABX5A7U2_RATRA|nr:hypothetical protein [Rathayibacter rathayi NCPPB 2980 = VKM Ac-1601]PPG65165.1 hypothetical protein C5C16_13605 [Rathayibacter rathayi]PPG74218.1 hypothetical protein C5C15_15270 [Rathayibacter rathayi]PPG87570.1 hypothetical protein C5C47_10180 [Rathayibacter rathayi]PPG95142.1 hypothetical protein C5C00_10850 [Rathayibacter rathayi]
MFSREDLAGELAAQLTCGEVDALAGLFRAYGQGEAANLWVAGHATTDDEGDAHHTSEGAQR